MRTFASRFIGIGKSAHELSEKGITNMLALHRRIGESIILSHPAIGNIKIMLVEAVSHRRAKLGIEAPASVEIRREELPTRQSQQGEEAPNTFYKADRERAKIGLTPLQLAYVERLEMALRAADEYQGAMMGLPHSPAQHSLENNLLIQMSKVNFLSSCDSIKQEEENELPRDVIFK